MHIKRWIYFIRVYERKLDSENNDIFFDADKRCVARISDFADSTAQRIKTYLQTFLGECFCDRNAGVEWYEKILGQNVLAIDAAKAEIREKILLVPGVKKIESIKVSVKGRNTEFSYTVVLDDGSIIKDSV